MNETIVVRAEKYIKNLLSDQMNKNFLYHSQGYTNKTVNKAKKVLEFSTTESFDINNVLLSTWFLHAGFAVDYNNHIKESVKLATSFLKDNNCEQHDITIVTHLIESGWKNDKPTNNAEAIVKDVC